MEQKKIFKIVLPLVLGFLVMFSIHYFFGKKTQPNKPQEAKTSWDQAVQLLQSGGVAAIAQSHDRTVSFLLKDGRRIAVKSPKIDDIFREIEACGESCKGVVVATE